MAATRNGQLGQILTASPGSVQQTIACQESIVHCREYTLGSRRHIVLGVRRTDIRRPATYGEEMEGCHSRLADTLGPDIHRLLSTSDWIFQSPYHCRFRLWFSKWVGLNQQYTRRPLIVG